MNRIFSSRPASPRQKRRQRREVLLLGAIICLLAQLLPTTAQQPPNASPLLTYDEIIELYRQENPPAPLQAKLDALLTTPFVSNTAAERGIRPLKPHSKLLGRFLRVAQWNIERGIEFDAIRAAFSDPARLAAFIDKTKYPRGSLARARILQQVEILKEADVVVLNEVDWGVRRSKYRNVAAELAAALKMNYAYGVEFVEVDPVQLGIEKFEGADERGRAELMEHIEVDAERYRGLHGTAILSRFRLDNVRLVPFKFQGHDWYADEKKGAAKLELGKRTASEKVFLEKVTREVRRGGRMMLFADISDPDIPSGKATIIATHLESRTKPENRAKQLRELLDIVEGIEHPVVLAGDMNTSTTDQTPTSIQREIKKRLGSEKFWVTQGIKYATGVGLLFDVVKGGVNFTRKYADPTVKNVRFIAENPESKFFDLLKDFRFRDGNAFDFRGERARSSNGLSDTLANSNERAGKGFATTFAVNRTIGPTGKFKLDWIFVKPAALTEPTDRKQSYRFAPHFGRTLEELNNSLPDRISDHYPIITDMPYGEPLVR